MPGSQQKLARKVTEADLREWIRDLCKLFGWKMYFTWKSYHSPKGFPDLVLANPGQKRVIFAELKTEKGKVTPEQQEWLDVLKDCGQEVRLWRPSDIEAIALILNPCSTYNPAEFVESPIIIRGKSSDFEQFLDLHER